MKYDFRDNLKDIIPKDKLNLVNRSFEIIGDIAITEIPQELIEYEKQIGEAIIQNNKNVETVLKKSGIHTGEFRTQQLQFIAGIEKKETTYNENGIFLKINSFSPRLSTERQFLMENLKEDSRVLVMFSGGGPYTFVAMKKQPDIQRITSIEINPEGHKYAIESSKLNKNLLKKSQIYINLIEFLRGNNIKINEKQINENLTNLKSNFFNSDVKKEVDNLTIKPTNKTFKNENHNYLLKKYKPKEIVEQIEEIKEKELIFDFDHLKDPEDLVPFLILFCDKFKFSITIKNQNYYFDTNYKKGLLLNYLENECEIEIEKIGLFDEIFMPLPKDASNFLDEALKIADTGATIHMYDFVHENEFPHASEDKVINAGKKNKIQLDILDVRKVSQYSPRKYRVCVDFKIID